MDTHGTMLTLQIILEIKDTHLQVEECENVRQFYITLLKMKQTSGGSVETL